MRGRITQHRACLGKEALAIVDVALMLVYLPIFSRTITFCDTSSLQAPHQASFT